MGLIDTGVIRRIDDLGRIVITKEVRRKLRLHEGDPLQIFVNEDDSTIVLKRYSPLNAMSQYADIVIKTLHNAGLPSVAIYDLDYIVKGCIIGSNMTPDNVRRIDLYKFEIQPVNDMDDVWAYPLNHCGENVGFIVGHDVQRAKSLENVVQAVAEMLRHLCME